MIGTLIILIVVVAYILYKLDHSHVNVKKHRRLIGKVGTTETNFVAKGTGIVRILDKNKNNYFSAINITNLYITKTSMVKVVDVFNDILYIQKY